MKRTSTEARVYMRRHQGTKVKHFDVSNVIYHKSSHGAVSYTLNGENVNVMLELKVTYADIEHFDVSNVIYHKFSHAVSYTHNGENVNVMLELGNNFSLPEY